MDRGANDARAKEPSEARYANYFKVGHNAYEFVLDFGQSQVGRTGDGSFHTRIVTGPVYAKALLKVLGESVDHFEQRFGRLPDQE